MIHRNKNERRKEKTKNASHFARSVGKVFVVCTHFLKKSNQVKGSTRIGLNEAYIFLLFISKFMKLMIII